MVKDNVKEDLFKLNKKKAEISLARTTVSNFINNVMPTTGLSYNYQYVDNGIELHIKMEHHRLIQVRLTQRTYMKVIQNLLPTIAAIKATFDAIETGINIKVVNHRNRERFTTPTTENNNQ